MPDQTIMCSDCDTPFLFGDGEQSFYKERGLQAPRRCKACRDKRRAAGGNTGGGRAQMHDATCAKCGAACQVPFQPMEGRDVYCRACFVPRPR